MRLRVNNGRDNWYDANSYVEPLRSKKNLIVAIDPSKTNCAILVGTADREILHIAECSGNDKQFYDAPGDTTEYCAELRDYLTKLLKGNPIIGFYPESPINPWQKKKFSKGGYEHYKSQMVLTEIRGSILTAAKEICQKPAIEITNTAWKGKILPDGYRGHSEKGSHRFLSELDTKWLSYSHDVTDVVCLYLYVVNYCLSKERVICNGVEKKEHEFNLCIMDVNAIPKSAHSFVANINMTCEQNAIYFANRESMLGAAKLDINKISLEDLNKYCLNMYTTSDPYLLVKRV